MNKSAQPIVTELLHGRITTFTQPIGPILQGDFQVSR